MSGLTDQAVSSSSTNSSVPLRLSSRVTESLSSTSCSVSGVCWSATTGVDWGLDTREDSDSVASLSCVGVLVQALVNVVDMTSEMATTNNLVTVETLVLRLMRMSGCDGFILVPTELKLRVSAEVQKL